MRLLQNNLHNPISQVTLICVHIGWQWLWQWRYIIRKRCVNYFGDTIYGIIKWDENHQRIIINMFKIHSFNYVRLVILLTLTPLYRFRCLCYIGNGSWFSRFAILSNHNRFSPMLLIREYHTNVIPSDKQRRVYSLLMFVIQMFIINRLLNIFLRITLKCSAKIRARIVFIALVNSVPTDRSIWWIMYLDGPLHTTVQWVTCLLKVILGQ